MEKPRKIIGILIRGFKFYKLLAKDSRIPRKPKIFLAIALAYLAIPFDLIMDFIPLLGQLDDVTVIATMIYLALKAIPKEIVEEHRNTVSKDQQKS